MGGIRDVITRRCRGASGELIPEPKAMPSRFPKFDPIKYLVIRKFPYLYPMTPGLELPANPFPNGVEAYREEAETYANELRGLPSEELNALVTAEKAKGSTERKIRADLVESRMWYNQPDTKADFDYWSKAAYWSLEESVALCFGKDPHRVVSKSVKPYTKVSPFAANYEKVRDLILRAKELDQLYIRNTPGFFLAWAKRSGIEYPEELEKAVEARGGQIADWKTLYDQLNMRFEEMTSAAEARKATHKEQVDRLLRDLEMVRKELAVSESGKPHANVPAKELKTRERETVLKLIIGMAVSGYRYDPKAARSDTVGDIVGDLDELGLHLDPDTVRKWLREAAELMPPVLKLD